MKKYHATALLAAMLAQGISEGDAKKILNNADPLPKLQKGKKAADPDEDEIEDDEDEIEDDEDEIEDDEIEDEDEDDGEIESDDDDEADAMAARMSKAHGSEAQQIYKGLLRANDTITRANNRQAKKIKEMGNQLTKIGDDLAEIKKGLSKGNPKGRSGVTTNPGAAVPHPSDPKGRAGEGWTLDKLQKSFLERIKGGNLTQGQIEEGRQLLLGIQFGSEDPDQVATRLGFTN